MSHASGAVKFNDGTIMFCEYDGTSGYMIPNLYKNFDEMNANWRNHPDYEEDKCHHELEDVEILSNYVKGFYWKGKACRKCNFIIEHLVPDHYEEPGSRYFVDIRKDEDLQEWHSYKGHPDWSPFVRSV